jgi:tetratricopeptide (TPR) repeat protein
MTAGDAVGRWVLGAVAPLLLLLAVAGAAAASERTHSRAEISILEKARQELADGQAAAALATLRPWPGDPSPFHQLLLGRALAETGEAAAAAVAYRAAVDLAPTMAAARQALLAHLHGQGDYAAICRLAPDLLDAGTGPHAELVVFADAAYRAGDRALCDQLAGLGLRRFPGEPAYRRLLLLRAMDDDDHRRARAYLRDALAVEPAARDLWQHLAAACRALDDDAGERAALRAVVLVDPADQTARRQLLLALLAAGQVGAAADQARALMAAAGDAADRDTTLICAAAAEAAGDLPQARAWAERLPAEITDHNVLMLRVRLLLAADAREEAHALLARALTAGAGDADLLLLAATNALHLDRASMAEDWFGQVLAVLDGHDGRRVAAALGRGQLLLARGAVAEAVDLLRDERERFPAVTALQILLRHAQGRQEGPR